MKKSFFKESESKGKFVPRNLEYHISKLKYSVKLFKMEKIKILGWCLLLASVENQKLRTHDKSR